MITHHLPSEWLLAEAAGTNAAARSLLVQTHLTYCPQCRGTLAVAEAAASTALAEPIEPPEELLAGLMARLDEPEPSTRLDSPWPGPVGALLPEQRWLWRAPGVWTKALALDVDGVPVRLIKMRPGASLHHTDGGAESAVVLQGGWTDQTGHYQRGDVYHHDEGHAYHAQEIDPGEACVALVANAARVKLGWPTRWIVDL